MHGRGGGVPLSCLVFVSRNGAVYDRSPPCAKTEYEIKYATSSNIPCESTVLDQGKFAQEITDPNQIFCTGR